MHPRWYVVFVAAAVLGWSSAGAEDEPVRFHDAVKLFEAQKYEEAYALFETLAKEWDSRAQIVLGSALVNGSLIPRDIPRGIAWLRIAAGESNVSPTTRARAAEQLGKYEAVLSGTDLIRADAIAGELQAARMRERDARIASAYARLQHPGRTSGEVKPGCALDPTLPRCGAARPDLKASGSVCTPLPAAERWVDPEADRTQRRFERPEYPERARRLAWEGRVVIAAYVDGSGWVCSATVADGSGIQALDTAALEAVRRWRLTPRLVDGRPTPYLYDVDVTYVLSNYVLK